MGKDMWMSYGKLNRRTSREQVPNPHRRSHVTGAIALASVLSLILAAPMALGQDRDAGGKTFLVADSIQFDRDTETLEASGAVEIFFDGLKLTAPSVVYDGRSDDITVGGPLTLTDATSGATTRAEFAQLDADMQNFLLVAVRHLMRDQLQIAANEMERREGRYSEWRSVVASYCQVCEDRPTPLWEIRARRATHDQLERMVYFQHAQFRVAGVPLAYTPYLRMPDPTVTRATGLVRASLRSSSLTGTTLRLPYFIVLDDHSDLTLTPGISIGGTANPFNTLEARYRQAFRYGDLEINSAISRDTLTSARTRAYLFANGDFAFPSGFDLSFQIQSASDRTYLTTYNFFDGSTETYTGRALNFTNSTLNSNINISRIRPDEIIQLNAVFLNSLRPETVTTDHPSHILAAEYARWFDIPGLPGNFNFSSVAQADVNEYGPNNARQRDIARIFTGLRWQESWKLGPRLILDTELAGFSDTYEIRDDATRPPSQSTMNSLAVVALRWPIERSGAGGVRHVIEPFLRQIAFAGDPISVPDVDGTIDNFDPNGRFAISRFRRIDRNRDLNSTEIGVDYMAHLPSGWSLGGRVERDYFWNIPKGDYSGGSLYTGRVGYTSGGLLFNASRAYNSEFFAVSDRVALSYRWGIGTINTSYTRIGVDRDLSTTSKTDLLSLGFSLTPNENVTFRSNLTRDIEASDASFFSSDLTLANMGAWSGNLFGNYSIDDAEFDSQRFNLSRSLDWGGDVNLFYDYDREAQRSVGLELDYINDCVNLGSQLVRRRSVIDTSEPAVELSLTVEVGGFAGRRAGRCG